MCLLLECWVQILIDGNHPICFMFGIEKMVRVPNKSYCSLSLFTHKKVQKLEHFVY